MTSTASAAPPRPADAPAPVPDLAPASVATGAASSAPGLPPASRQGGPRVNAMSVDVEDYFQVQAFAGVVARAHWESIPRRVEDNMARILDLFAEAGARATFFTLGWIAERHPRMVRRIVEAGHELASHGYDHRLVHELGARDFTADVARSRAVLEDIGGAPVVGYRAPTFSIGPRTPWAYPALAEAGYRYSSSVFPVSHDLYGDPSASRTPFRPGGGAVWELPMTTVRLGGRNLPCSGGGYFRLVPYPLFRAGLRRVNAADGQPGMFYFHPWEVDPDQPVVAGCGMKARFRHRVNLARMAPRLRQMLRDFAWDRVDQVYAEVLAAPTAEQPRKAA